MIRATRDSNRIASDGVGAPGPLEYRWELSGFYGGLVQQTLGGDMVGWSFEVSFDMFWELLVSGSWNYFRYKRELGDMDV